MFYANLWIFKDLMASVMESDPLQSTLIRTSTGLTMFNSGIKVRAKVMKISFGN